MILKYWEFDKKEGKLRLQKIIRDDVWSELIGTLQFDLEALTASQIQKSVCFDFTNCRWIDPIPALSLLIEMTYARNMGIEVSAKFSAGIEENESEETGKEQSVSNSNQIKNSIEIYPDDPNKLLRFLAKEGYFQALIDTGIKIFDENESIDVSTIQGYCELNVESAYEDPSFVNFHFFNVPQLDEEETSSGFAAKTVEELLSDVERFLRTRCSPSERHHLLYVIRATLQEFFHNTQEHAYPHSAFKPVGIYVRYRKGGARLSTSSERELYTACVNQENSRCQGTSPDWMHSKQGCLEVFFIDRGIGILQSLKDNLGFKGSFVDALKTTFIDGKSSKEVRKTEYGGLHLLHNLLSRNNDYVRAIEGNAWYGSPVPLERVPHRPDPVETELNFIGLAYHLRLSWKAHTDESEAWLRFSGQGNESISLLSSLPDELENPLIDKSLVVDDRFGLKASNNIKTDDYEFILWLPKRNLMKWDVLKGLERISKYITHNGRLIIADIASFEAAVYEAAISSSRFDLREKWPRKYKWITLATNRWSFAHAKYVSDIRHGFSPLKGSEIPKGFCSGISRISAKNLQETTFRRWVVDWVKLHDSNCFWSHVNKENRLFLAEKVTWEEDENHIETKHINGYLDFPAVVHDRFCAQLLRNALARVIGFFPRYGLGFRPIDSLTAPVIHEVHAYESFNALLDENINRKTLTVGSVLVSGQTLNSMEHDQNVIHFFVHGDSSNKANLASLFYWNPVQEIQPIPMKTRQKRIGKTSAIAPEGWKSIEIPRCFDEKKGPANPVRTYLDWQSSSPIIVKPGHWHYEGHHDFITVNIPDAVDDAFARNNELAQFLVKFVLSPLGVTASSLINDKLSISDNNKDFEPNILVYRSHPSIERILEKVLQAVTEDTRAKITKWIFPILPLRMKMGGSTLLLPPNTKEAIQKALLTRKKVTIFDDAAISGRTIQDLMTSLRAIGATEVNMTIIVNRLRLPAEMENRINYYWRLDVPTMGREGSCPLCQAINTGRSFTSSLVKGSKAYETLQEWINIWATASPLNSWHSGLEPLPLRNQEDTKKFCWSPSKQRYQIENLPIKRSTGLMIHSSELHAMTAIDTYGNDAINSHADPAIKVGLAASQLLLFGDEFDHELTSEIIINGLVQPLAELPSDSPYSPLALLILMHELSNASSEIKGSVLEEINKLEGSFRYTQHRQLFVAFLVHLGVIPWTDTSFFAGTRLLSTRHRNIADKLRSLYRETISKTGDHHSEAISRLIQALDSYQKNDGKVMLTNDQIWGTMNSIASLESLLNEIGHDLARPKKNYQENRESLVNALSKAKDKLPKVIKGAMENIRKGLELMNRNKHDENAELAIESGKKTIKTRIALLEDVLNKLRIMLQYYFESIKPEHANSFSQYIERELNKVVFTDEYKKYKEKDFNPCIKLSSASRSQFDFGKAKEISVVMIRPITNILRDLMLNCIDRHVESHDPWSTNSSSLADAWLRINFQPAHVEISMANAHSPQECSLEIFKKVQRNAESKSRWSILDELGGSIKLTDELNDPNVFSVTITLPYAPYLKSSYPNGANHEI